MGETFKVNTDFWKLQFREKNLSFTAVNDPFCHYDNKARISPKEYRTARLFSLYCQMVTFKDFSFFFFSSLRWFSQSLQQIVGCESSLKDASFPYENIILNCFVKGLEGSHFYSPGPPLPENSSLICTVPSLHHNEIVKAFLLLSVPVPTTVFHLNCKLY